MNLHRLNVLFVAVTVAAPAGAVAKNSVATPAARSAKASSKRVHKVQDGETLWAISRLYGCTVDDMKGANKLRTNMIHPGAELTIPSSCGAAAAAAAAVVESTPATTPAPAATPAPAPDQAEPTRKAIQGMMSHTVASGDTLFKIAQRYDTSVDDIVVRNGMSNTTIFPGQRLDIAPGSRRTMRAILGQSKGHTHRGRLVNASRLTNGRGYYIRRPTRTFGANHVVHSVRRAVDVVRRKYPRTHKLAIGDISSRKGGRLSGHRSHQSGRDVDVGFYFKRRPNGYPSEFKSGLTGNLHLGATWALVSTFAGMADSNHGVERIFLGYEMQRLLYHYAKNKGVSQKTLRRMFQYPHGRETPHGIIRHEPAHNDHVHVRFKCPEGDKGCL